MAEPDGLKAYLLSLSHNSTVCNTTSTNKRKLSENMKVEL